MENLDRALTPFLDVRPSLILCSGSTNFSCLDDLAFDETKLMLQLS